MPTSAAPPLLLAAGRVIDRAPGKRTSPSKTRVRGVGVSRYGRARRSRAQVSDTHRAATLRREKPCRVCAGYERDILWAFFPGADPAKLLEKRGTRFQLLHLKDLRRGVKGDLSGQTAVEYDVALGTGQLDLPGILKAAKKAGVKHYYIEDESPNTATQVPLSLADLKGLKP